MLEEIEKIEKETAALNFADAESLEQFRLTYLSSKGKIQVLEKSLGQIVEDFEKEKELVRYQHEQIIRDQKEEVISMHSIILTDFRSS